MKYIVTVVDCVCRQCSVEVEAENEKRADEKVRDIWADGGLEADMENGERESEFVDSYVTEV